MAQVPLHGFDSGAERGSGWTDNVQKPRRAPEDVQNTMRDPGEVNEAQARRIEELEVPLENGDTNTGVEVEPEASAPDIAPSEPGQIDLDPGLLRAAQFVPQSKFQDYGQKMGLRAHSDGAYARQAVRLQLRDAALGAGLGLTASDYYDGDGEMGENCYFDRANEMPGSASQFGFARRDNPLVNDLEQVRVTNPMATALLLDKGTFSTHYRGLAQYPPAMRQFLHPM